MQFGLDWRRRKGGRQHAGGGVGGAPASGADGRVEMATGEVLDGPDWGLNLDICDTINSFEWQAKDVVKAIMKRLQHRNAGVQTLALSLLETMIKNCGENVHLQVAQSDILQELVKIVKKKTDVKLRDKILLLLESWQEAFGGPKGKYPQYYQAYAELKKSGIKFPKRSEDTAPIFTPPITHPARHRHLPARHGASTKSSAKLHEAMATEMGNLSLSDLVSIRRVMELLSDMLQAVNPNDCMAVKDEVIVDLVRQCQSNQNKIMHLVSSTGDEELLGLGLGLNDKLRNLIAKHDAIKYGSPLTESSESAPRGSVSSASGACSIGQIVEEDEDDEDDGFSQLARRNSKMSPVPCQSSSNETTGQGICGDRFTGTPHTSREGNSPFITSNPLSLPDFPSPAIAAAKEHEILGHLSITPTTNVSSQHTPLMHPHVLNPDRYEVDTSLKAEARLNSQLYTIDHGYISYDSYIVPWAQQNLPQPVLQPQSLFPQGSSHYPPPPWEIDTNDRSDMSTSYGPTHAPVLPSRPLQQHNSFASSRDSSFASIPLQRCHSFGSTVNYSYVSKTLQQPHSFGSSVNEPFASKSFQPYSSFASSGDSSFASKPLQKHHSFGLTQNNLFDSESHQQNHLSGSRVNNFFASKPVEQQNSIGSREHNLASEMLPSTSMNATQSSEAVFRSFGDPIEQKTADGRMVPSEITGSSDSPSRGINRRE